MDVVPINGQGRKRVTLATPADLDVERSVLGGLLLKPGLIPDVGLDPRDFYVPQHEHVFRAMLDVQRAGQPVDTTTVEIELERAEKLDAIGGLPFIAGLALHVPDAKNTLAYAQHVREAALTRAVRLAMSEVEDEAQHRGTRGEELLALLRSVTERFAAVEAKPRAQEMRTQLLSSYASEIIAQSKVPLVDWGFKGLNVAAPWPVRSIASLTGPTGGGKTSLALTIAAHHARDQGGTPVGGPVIYALAELTPAQLAARRVSQLSPFTWRQVLGGALAESELDTWLAGSHVYVLKVRRGENFLDAIARATDEVTKACPGLPMLVVDYLQRIRGPGRELREQTSNIVDGILDLVESRDMVSLVLSRGSRSSSQRMRDGESSGEALVDAAAETAAIEYSAAAQLAITFENREGGDDTDARVAVSKARFGMPGTSIGMRMSGAHGSWTELDALPPPKVEREALLRIREIAQAQPDGFEHRTALQKAVGGNRKAVMAVIARELEPGGSLALSGGRIVFNPGPGMGGI